MNLVSYLDSIKFHTGGKLNIAYYASLSLTDYRRHLFGRWENGNRKYTDQQGPNDSKA